MTRVRSAAAAVCIAAATFAFAPASQALDPGITKKFNNVSIMLDKPNFSQLATAIWWCMQRGFATQIQYQFDYLQTLGQGYGYSANYKHITCIRGVQS